MKKESNNTKYLNGGKRMNLVKSFGAVLGTLAISLILFQGCTSSTGSSSSGSGSLPRVQVTPAASSLQASQQSTVKDPVTGNFTNIFSSTFITVIVRDNNGNLVPAGTPVNITCGAGFLGDTPDVSNPISSITVSTDSNGQVQVKYTAPFLPPSLSSETATISATSQGNFGSATITIGGTK
jgi:hypothetical protein